MRYSLRIAGGYTLIELLISMAIFSVVMLGATSAYLSFIAYNRQAQATTSVMNSVSFSIDSMAREVRSGSNYAVASNVLTFTNADDCIVTYKLDAPSKSIVRSAIEDTGNDCPASEVTSGTTTDANVVISTLHIVGRGLTGKYEPMVVISINGYATIANTGPAASATKVPFQIETAATERLPVLPAL